MTTAKWDRFEARLTGPQAGNPYVDVELSATFRHENRQVYVEGFYDGDGQYAIRFMPDMEGQWSYTTASNAPELNGLTGSFECTPAREGVHGPVYVATATAKDLHRHVPSTRLKYADGTDYSCVGTTCYCWAHQGDELEELTLKTLSEGYFNKLRMCMFPKHYEFNANEPVYFPFPGGKVGDGYEWDFTRFVPEYWAHMEKRIDQLAEMGIEADLILFHPYDRWGFSKMPREADYRYLRYLVARLSSFRNVWWSFANEYDLMPDKSMEDWDNFFKFVQAKDPAQHLRSIHNCRQFYDHAKPWVTHASIQHADMERISEWMAAYQKPIVIDECCYEGNIPNYWGNISAVEMMNRMWDGFVRGAYVGHGETYLDPDDVLWWAKGGALHGESPARIKFLKALLESMPADPTPAYERTRVMGLNYGEEQYLYYYGVRQSGYKLIDLPEDKQYRAEVIDAWNMTITPVEGTFSGKAAQVPMLSKPYCGFRLVRIG